MQKFICSLFGWSMERTEKFVGNSTEEEIIGALIASVPEGMHLIQYERALPALLHRRTLLEVGEWVLRNDLRVVFASLTRLELRTVRCINPYYLYFAHDVEFGKCTDFASQYAIVVDSEAVTYAVAVSILRQRKVCSVDELHNELAVRGVPIPHGRTVDTLAAFPVDHMDGHPLVEDDVDLVPAGVLSDKIRRFGGGGNPVDVIRERKFMQNRVVLHKFRYTFKSRSSLFVSELQDIKQRAGANEARIKEVYKRLKT